MAPPLLYRPTPEHLLFQLGETAADLLAAPDSSDRRLRLTEAVEVYDGWRLDREMLRGAPDAPLV